MQAFILQAERGAKPHEWVTVKPSGKEGSVRYAECCPVLAPSPQPNNRVFDTLLSVRPDLGRTAFCFGSDGERSCKMEQQNELCLTRAEKRIIAELRQLKYGEMRIVMRNGVPVQMEATRSEKLEEK